MAEASGAACGEEQGSPIDQLPTHVLAAVASDLPSADLIRFSLASRSIGAALAGAPRLYSAACTRSLGWPAPRSRQPSPPASAIEHPRRLLEQQGEQGQHAYAAAPTAPDAHAVQGPPVLDPPAAGSSLGAGAAASASAAAAAAALSADEAFCRDLLSATSALAAAAAPHCLKPQAQAPSPNVVASIGRAPGFALADPLELWPPLVLTERQQCLLTLGAPGAQRLLLRACNCGLVLDFYLHGAYQQASVPTRASK